MTLRPMAILFAAALAGAAAQVAAQAAAQAGAQAAEDEAKHLTCTFEQGYSWSYSGGGFAHAAPNALSFEISGIDLEGQAAELIVDAKPGGKLRIVRALNANHFLEVANEGFLNLTTVYDRDPASGKSPAVHSRHFGLLGQPMFAQYAGMCVVKTP